MRARCGRGAVHRRFGQPSAGGERSAGQRAPKRERGFEFADLGADYLGRIDKHRTAKRLVRHLDAIGYEVMLRPKTATA